MNHLYYILDDDGEPLAVPDSLTWGLWLEQGPERRIVAQTQIGPYLVSTVFLGLDHNFSDTGPPVLWETMVFHADSGWEDIQCHRYTTRQIALDEHAALVARLVATTGESPEVVPPSRDQTVPNSRNP